MAPGRATLRFGASLIAALLIGSTLSSGVAAAPPPSAGSSPAMARRDAGVTGPNRPALDLKLTERTAQARGSVNVRRLAARKPTKRLQRTLPFLSTGGSAATTKPSKPSKAPKPRVVGPPDPVEAAINGDGPAFQTSFNGLARSTNAATDGEPPDPWVAVGPEHIVQAVNLAVRMTDRNGGTHIDISLPDFFELPASGFFDSDPHVIYDSLHGRWLATEVSWDCIPDSGTDPNRAFFGHGYLDFAVSRTRDPTGTWDQHYVTFNDQLPDYPAPGTTTDKIGFASNLFDMVGGADCLSGASPFFGGDVLYVDWADLLDGGGVAVRESLFPATLVVSPTQTVHWFTPRVAVQVPATSSRMQIVMQYDFGSGDVGLGYVSLVGGVKAGTLRLERLDSLTEEYQRVAPFIDPPVPKQPGPGTITDAVDSRPTDAIVQGDRLVLVSTGSCQPGGDSTQRDCVRVTELNTSTVPTDAPTLTQDFLVASNGKDSYMGGVGLAGDGTLHVGWTRSSTAGGAYPSSYTAHQVLGDTLTTLSAPEQLGNGTGAYPGTRWGDYVGVAQDPQVPSQAWDANQFSVGPPGWATKVSRLQTLGTTYVPIAAVRVLDTRHNIGLNNPFVANTPRSWQVATVGTIPAGAVAVTGNLTVTGQSSAGYVSVTVTPRSAPASSTINFPVGQTRANNVTIPLSPTGKLSAVYKGAGKTGLVFDVTGYFLADDSGATFTTVTPVRALDTRDGTGLPGPFSANVARTLLVGGTVPGVPTTAIGITANLTIVSPTKAGYASVTTDLTNAPTTSTINFPTDSVRANGVFARLDGTHSLSIVYKAGAGGTADIVLDITGYFEPGTGGLRFVPMTPSRIMDSRSSAVLSGSTGKFSSGTPKTLAVQAHWGVPDGAEAVIGNLTVVGQTAGGYVSATPDPDASPTTSTLNFPLGDTMANGIVAPLNGGGASSFVYKASPGKTTDLILDLAGYFE